ncbi:MAG: precorrin-2 C(20)-methyltransferase [Candidatus Bathyarchaeia archaeon]
MKGRFIGLGVGPGDPELITVKAIRALQAADIVCIPKSYAHKPSLAFTMIKSILDERKIPAEILELIFPMTKDELCNKALWDKNAGIIAQKAASGKAIAFITLGDPMFYSTFIYLYQTLKESYPKLPLEIIPGVTSMTACAASAKIPLAEKEEVISIIPSDLDPKLVEETAKHADNLVFIKCAYRLKELIPIVEKSGFTENSTIALIRRCTMPEEEVLIGKLSDVKNWKICEDYFSVAIIKKREFRE